MNRYVVKLVHNYNETTQQFLEAQGIHVRFADGVLPDVLIVECTQTLAELQEITLFKRVTKERIGRVDI